MSLNQQTQALRFAALHYPNKLAIIDDDRQLTYAQLQVKVDSLCAQLVAQGLTAKDHVMSVSENNLHLVCLQLACLQMNLLFCPISPRFSHNEIIKLASQLACQFIWSPNKLTLASHHKPLEINLDAPITPSSNSCVSPSIHAQQACNIILSSGSTGSPKAIVHSYHNHYASAQGALECIALNSTDRWLLSLPLYHIGGFAIVMRCLFSAATIVLNSKQDLAMQINKHKISHLSLVSTQLWRLLKEKNVSITSLKACIIGGGPVSGELLKLAEKKSMPCFISYGLSEMSSQVATAKANQQQSCGFALPKREFKLTNVNNNIGQILVKGDTLALGYYNKGLKLLPKDDSNWFHTGDLAELSPQGLIIKGRSNNMLISGGENIYPEEIEAHLLQLPCITSALVVAIDDPEFGQRPLAFIDLDLTSADLLNIEQIKQYLTTVMAAFKVPEHFLTWPDNLKTKTLKPNRIALQKFAKQWLNSNSALDKKS